MLHQVKIGWRNFTKVVSRFVTSTFQVGSCSKWENLTKSKPLVSFMCARPVWYLLPKKLDKQRPDWNHYLDKINIHLSLLHTKNGWSVPDLRFPTGKSISSDTLLSLAWQGGCLEWSIWRWMDALKSGVDFIAILGVKTWGGSPETQLIQHL